MYGNHANRLLDYCFELDESFIVPVNTEDIFIKDHSTDTRYKIQGVIIETTHK